MTLAHEVAQVAKVPTVSHWGTEVWVSGRWVVTLVSWLDPLYGGAAWAESIRGSVFSGVEARATFGHKNDCFVTAATLRGFVGRAAEHYAVAAMGEKVSVGTVDVRDPIGRAVRAACGGW